MNNRFKTSRWMFGLAAAGCALGVALPARVAAEVSDADFNALKDLVQQMNGKLQALEQTNQLDQQTIHQLQQQLAETQRSAADAQQKSAAAAETQPVPRTPIDEATVNHNFQILGDAEFQYDKADGQHGSFLLADFAPIFLYRGGDNILFEAGFDTFIQNNAPNGGGYSTTFNLSFAQLDYVINDYITLCAGDMLLPVGTYTERGAGWLNKIPDDPLAVDALVPGTGVGAQLRGAIPVGDAGKFINYSVYGVNGPSSADGTGNAEALDLGGNVGLQSDGSTVGNLHSNPAGGARVGLFLPFKPHYDLEVGVSGMAGEWDNAGNHLWAAGVADAALHLGPNFEAKGEYIATKYGSDDLGNISQNGWFAQVGYKLAGLNMDMPVINNVELVGRYDSVRNGYDSVSNSFHLNTQRYTIGGIYYFTSTLLFEADYEFLDSNDPSQVNQLILQLSYGF
jgi:phosphate-selective porin